MGRRERRLTPPLFATWLVGRLRQYTQSVRVAALYVDVRGPYPRMADVQCWPLWAEAYTGPWPVVAHPPCGPWGLLSWNCRHQDSGLGILAIEQVHRYGGVVEQPEGSRLFREHGRRGAVVEKVYQRHWGHRAAKPTLLYWTVGGLSCHEVLSGGGQ